MRKILFIGILLFTIVNSFGQNTKDSIEIRSGFSTTFRQNGKLLTPKQMLDVTLLNSQAHEEMVYAKTNYDIGSVFAACGGFLIGWPCGTYLGGGKPNWNLALGGASLCLLTIPFNSAYIRHAKNAAIIYNSGLKRTSFNSINIQYGFTSEGIGITLKF